MSQEGHGEAHLYDRTGSMGFPSWVVPSTVPPHIGHAKHLCDKAEKGQVDI